MGNKDFENDDDFKIVSSSTIIIVFLLFFSSFCSRSRGSGRVGLDISCRGAWMRSVTDWVRYYYLARWLRT